MIEVKTWKTEWFATPYYGFASPEGKKALIIPRYQRTFVWKDSRRRALIDSILKGYPIGSIILRKTGELQSILDKQGREVECETYEIIDGLQRSTSIIAHALSPMHVATTEFVADIIRGGGIEIERVVKSIDSIAEDEVTEQMVVKDISDWSRKCTKRASFGGGNNVTGNYFVETFDKAKFTTNKLLDFLAEGFDCDRVELARKMTEDGSNHIIDQLLEQLLQNTSIEAADVPAIIWDGRSDLAAEIFQRLNLGGVKLSKYEVLAASWVQKFTDISEEHEIGKASKRILTPSAGANLIARGASTQVEKLDLFECMVGMSALLEKKFPTLFKEASSSAEDNEPENALGSKPLPHAAFNIASIICKTRLPVLEMAKLPQNMQNCEFLFDDDGNPSVGLLWEAILASCALVSESLIFLKYQFNKMNNPIPHQENAMSALVASFALAWLQSDENVRQHFDRNYQKFVRPHYLIDVLSGITDSHGVDAAAFNRVWVSESIVNNDGLKIDSSFSRNKHYLELPTRRSVEVSLDGFWERQSEKEITSLNKAAPQIDAKQKMVLKIMGSKRALWVDANNGRAVHIDHSIPFARIKKWSELNGGVAYVGGCVANLAILPAEVNLKMGKRTLDEWMAEDPNAHNVQVQDIWSMVPYEPGQLKVPRDEKTAMSPEDFKNLMDEVWATIKDDILKTVLPLADR
jgi:hypothetical protein